MRFGPENLFIFGKFSYFSIFIAHHQGRNKGGKGHNSLDAESLRGAKKLQQCHKHFLQYSTFAFKRPQVRTWGRQSCFLPQTPSNLVTPLHITIV